MIYHREHDSLSTDRYQRKLKEAYDSLTDFEKMMISNALKNSPKYEHEFEYMFQYYEYISDRIKMEQRKLKLKRIVNGH